MTDSDDTWRELREGHARLRWARLRWQKSQGVVNGSAKDAAASVGMKDGTYRAYERQPGASKHTQLDDQAAVRFGRKFKVNWIWLLTGQGSPFDDQLSVHVERAVKAMTDLPPDAQKTIADIAEALATTRTGTKG